MLKAVPIYSALNKPQLFMGGERELTMLLALVSAMLIFSAATFVTAILGILLWFGVLVLLRMMAKKDPLMSKIYKRQTKYQKYYRAKPSAYA